MSVFLLRMYTLQVKPFQTKGTTLSCTRQLTSHGKLKEYYLKKGCTHCYTCFMTKMVIASRAWLHIIYAHDSLKLHACVYVCIIK